MEIDPVIKRALAFTGVFLLALFLLSFTPGCAGAKPCGDTGWQYFLRASPNEVGDTLSGVATALAFFWLITAVSLQSKELREQRNEFHEMNIRLGSQQFEATFNDLLSSFLIVREAVKLEGSSGWQITGTDALQELSQSLMYSLGIDNDPPISPENLKRRYSEFWGYHGRRLAPYFRYLFNLYRFIDESSHKQVYHSRILRALLTDGEMILLMYNSLSTKGEPFMGYMEKYSVLDNMELSSLMHGSDILLVPRSVFGKNQALLDAWDDARKRYGFPPCTA
jgi:hypothetical protein